MRKSKIKILFVGPFPDPITGNSIANLTAYEGFKEKGYSVDLINSSLSFFDENVGAFSLKKTISSIKFNFQTHKIFLSNIIYITPGQTFFGILKYSFIMLFAKVFRKKIVIHIHGNYLKNSYKNSNKAQRIVMKTILSLADKGIVLSKSLVPNLTPFLKEKNISIIHNFVEDYIVEDIERKIKIKEIADLKIVFLSNLMEEKGIIDLLESLKILTKKGFKYKAKIAGHIDDKLKEKINGYFVDLPDADYLGIVKGDEKKEMLLWGNVFVFPTYYSMEGQPISIIEAMATGNLILTTKHAGIPDIFSIKNGLYIEKKNPHDIVNKLELVLRKKDKFNQILSENYLYSISTYSSKNYISNLERVFKF